MNLTNEQILTIAAGVPALAFLACWIVTARKAAKWRRRADNAVQQQEFLKQKHEQEALHARLMLDQERVHHKQELQQVEAPTPARSRSRNA